MTAVANPPSFQQLNRSGWNIDGSQNLNSMNNDDVRGIFMPRKHMQRSNSSSSISSTSSASSTTTVSTNSSQPNGTPASTNSDMSTWSSSGPRKRPQPKAPWPAGKPEGPVEMGRMAAGRVPMNGINGNGLQPGPVQPQIASQQGMGPRPAGETGPSGQPVLHLLSLNGTFERKTIAVPFYPDSLRIGRQTNQKTIPTPANGFFDSKVLSRQHAEIWADRMGKIFIRDVKSSNGTFVNGTRLSQENRESEPHELQTADHLELGIDIVSEDQKTVVHHKVAAKVEHAGFVSPSSNVLDMNFGDLDPANGGAMLATPQGAMPFRGRQGSNASMASNSRVIPATGVANPQMSAVPGRPGFLLNSVTADHIVKRLHVSFPMPNRPHGSRANTMQAEMRNAKLQSQDLGRTGQFISTLLSKEDVKDSEKPEVPEPPKPLSNGTPLSFRSDTKARFSDPPAPPPQQPLPEKPDVPSLKRATTERPKSHPNNGSPVRPDNLSQIIQLTEALNNAKKDLDTQTQRMKDLEQMLQREREAREMAEDLAKRLEDSAIAKETKEAADRETLEEAFEPPREATETVDVEMTDADAAPTPAENKESVEAVATEFQAKIDVMVAEMQGLRQQMETWKQRCETAESERDADRQSLADMVTKIRKDEEAREVAAREKSRSRSRRRGRSLGQATLEKATAEPAAVDDAMSVPDPVPEAIPEDPSDKPTLSRANTITPLTTAAGSLAVQDKNLAASLPYASMLGVVLIGVGLMTYLNGMSPTARPSQ